MTEEMEENAVAESEEENCRTGRGRNTESRRKEPYSGQWKSLRERKQPKTWKTRETYQVPYTLTRRVASSAIPQVETGDGIESEDLRYGFPCHGRLVGAHAGSDDVCPYFEAEFSKFDRTWNKSEGHREKGRLSERRKPTARRIPYSVENDRRSGSGRATLEGDRETGTEALRCGRSQKEERMEEDIEAKAGKKTCLDDWSRIRVCLVRI